MYIKSFLQIFQLFIIFSGLFELTSCNKHQIKSNNLEVNTTNEIVYGDSLKISNPFSLPSLLDLVNKSPILSNEAFGSDKDEIRFVFGDIIVLSIDEKIIYLELLPKTSEDNMYYIQMISQNLDENNISVVKKWEIDNSSGNEIILLDFFKIHEKEITEILNNLNSKPLHRKILFKQYIEIKNVEIVPKYQNKKDELEKLNLLEQVEIIFKDSQPLLLERNSKNPFCSICDELPIYKVDFLGELFVQKENINILVIGFLEQINHAPSALHIRFIKNEI